MDIISEILGGILEVIKETFSLSLKSVNVILWVAAACFILPCVFIASNIYPLWEKWGEQLKK